MDLQFTLKNQVINRIDRNTVVSGSGQFDGSQNLSINTNFGSGSVNRATTADKWTNRRTLTITNDASGSVSFDGSGNMSLRLTVNEFTTSHRGSRLGFFNNYGNSKQTCSNLTATPTLDNLKSKLNELIDDLQSYGLIG